MNAVKNSCSKPCVNVYAPGDVFIRDQTGELYILAFCDQKYYAISLADGRFWNYGQREIDIAVQGLSFLKRGALITVS